MGIAVFFVLALALTWAGTIPAALVSRNSVSEAWWVSVLGILAAVGPMLAAIAAARLAWGPGGPSVLWRSLFRGWKRVDWWFVAVGLPIVVGGLALTLAAAIGGYSASNGVDWAFLPGALVGLLLLNVWEEMGFRGFAFEQMQRQISPGAAALLTGVMWAVWHLPLFFNEDQPLSDVPFVFFFAEIVGVSVLYGWLFNSTSGSLFFVTLFHATSNVVGIYGGDTDVPEASFVGCRALVVWVVAASLIAAFGWRGLAVKGARPDRRVGG